MKLLKKQNMSWGMYILKNPQIITFCVLIIMIIVFTIISPYNRDGENVFISTRNLSKVIENISVTAIGGLAMMIVMLSGGINLAASEMIQVSAVTIAILITTLQVNGWVAIIICLAVGALIGAGGAVFIVELKLPPFLATLAYSFVLSGLAYTLVDGQQSAVKNSVIDSLFGYNEYFSIPVLNLWLLIICIIVYLAVKKTKFGRNLQAIGGNEVAAKNSGVKVRKIKYLAYAISGCASAFVAMSLVGRLQVAAPNMGEDYALDFITVAVLGGTNFSGKGGSVLGLLSGAALVAFFKNGLDMLRVDIYIADLLQGMLILVAVVGSVIAEKRRNKK